MSDLTCHCDRLQVILIIAGDSDHRLRHLQPYQALCLISPVVTICRWFWSSPLSASALPSTVSDLTCCDYLQVILIFTCVSFSPTKHCVWSHLLLWLFVGDSDLHLIFTWSSQVRSDTVSFDVGTGEDQNDLSSVTMTGDVIVTDDRSFWSSPVPTSKDTVYDLTCCCDWLQVILIFTCVSDLTCRCD